MPWDHPTEATPETGIPNVVTKEGRELGAEIARLCPPADLCDGCACRLGTHANGCAPTLMSLVKCTMERTPFWCHKPEREGQLCAGYVALMASNTNRGGA